MGGPTLFSDGIWRLLKPNNPTGAGKYRCFVLLNGSGALPSPLAMLLVQIRVQGEDTNREGKAVYTEAQPSQLKSQKYRPILSHLVLSVAQAFDIYERAEMNQAEIYGAASSRSQKCLLGICFSRFEPPAGRTGCRTGSSRSVACLLF